MLRFESLLFRNFGPFKGFQEVNFPKGPGVVLVVGANMRGKTSFLNGIRFALFGATLSRAGKAHRLIDLINDEAKAEGSYEMRISLGFMFQRTAYKITRVVNPIDATKTPQSDADLRNEMHLERDGVHLSQSESERELRRILPPSVARFFLFDGELLQQYEELLSQSESAMRGDLIEAIEKILGVPVLLHARRHLDELKKMAERDLDQALTKDRRHQKLGEDSRQVRLTIETLERDLSQGLTLLAGFNARIREIEGVLSENAELIELLKDRDRVNDGIAGLKRQIEGERDRLGTILPHLWKEMIGRVASNRSDVLESNRDALLKELGGLQQVEQRARALREALDSAICPTCGRPMESAGVNSARLEEEIRGLEVDPERIAVLNQEIASVNRHLKTLRNAPLPGQLRRADEIQKSIDGLVVDLTDAQRRLKKLNSSIEGRDGAPVNELQRDLQQVVEARGATKKSQQKLGDELEAARAEQKRLQAKIPSDGDSEQVELARAKTQTASQLLQLFGDSVGVFRDSLRRKVEARSTEMFLKLTSEPDYAGLSINENYGLSIIRIGGDPVNIRSAGAEHIVAFALISALQSSSPRPGPVFIDSPFGRLDEIHSRNVVKALPQFSEQVVLLVHEKELDLDAARGLLKDALKVELRLERRSSSHTEIVEV